MKLHVLQPRKALRGPSLDFDPAKLRAWYEDGLRTAREAETAGVALEREEDLAAFHDTGL